MVKLFLRSFKEADAIRNMTYKGALKYLNSFINYEKKADYSYSRKIFGLKRISLLLEKLGSPHKEIRTIHVAGSKGKGSVACFCASILKKAGFKTGLYTSPHLETFRERIKINDEIISKKEVVEFVQLIKPHIEKNNPPSFFEIYTALAFLYFKKKETDFVVVEVGLGGRLDATNVLNPLVCVITPISFEHTDKLGNTLRAITAEKCGIIKEGVPVVSSLQDKEAVEVIKEKACVMKSRCFVVGEDIFCNNVKSKNRAERFFNIRGVCGEYGPFTINLLGSHQISNATTAVGAIEALRFYDIVIPQEAIKQGLSQTHWPGRVEVVGNNPFIVLDGAQNVASVLALKRTIKDYFSYQRLILVLGISKDKDVCGMIKILKTMADKVIITRANLPRAAEPDFLASFFSASEDVEITQSVEEAVKAAKALAKRKDLILVCGSLFVVGEARPVLLAQRIE